MMAIDEVECRIRIQKQGGEWKKDVFTKRRRRKIKYEPD